MLKYKYALYLIAMLFLIGCGTSTATDVGNPTTDKYILTGQISFASANITIKDADQNEAEDEVENENNNENDNESEDYESIPLYQYIVRATDENFENIDAIPNVNGNFKIELLLQKTYSMYVLYNSLEIAEFNFIQNDLGDKANRFRATNYGELDMGRLRFSNGIFEPEDDEHEPFRHGANNEDLDEEDNANENGHYGEGGN